MGKAAHVDVGCLFPLDDMGNWPRKGVMPMKPVKASDHMI